MFCLGANFKGCFIEVDVIAYKTGGQSLNSDVRCMICDVMERKQEDDILAEVLHTYIRLHTMEEGKWNR